jgi:hypothetical protein
VVFLVKSKIPLHEIISYIPVTIPLVSRCCSKNIYLCFVILIVLLLNISFTYFASSVCNVDLLKSFRVCPFKMKDIAGREFKLSILKPLYCLCMLRPHTPPSPTLSVNSPLLSFVCRLQSTLE